MLNNNFRNIIGLDISDLKIRFVQMSNRFSKKPTIKSFGEVDVPPNLIINGEIMNKNVVIELVKRLLEHPISGKVENQFVNASLPENKVFLKLISIPKVTEQEMMGAVAWGVEQNFPMAIDQLYFDWYKINDQNTEKTKKIQVLVSAAPKYLVDIYTEIIEKAGFITIGLENESIAIARCLINQSFNTDEPLLIIDLGKSRTNIMIYHNESIIFTNSLNINGTEMTKMVAKEIKLSFDDAEKAKKICGLDKRKGRGAVRKILIPIIDNLVDKILETMDYFDRYYASHKKISNIILTGSVSRMSGLTEYLNEKLNLSVIIGNSLINLNTKRKWPPDFKKMDFLSFSTAIGLSLKDIR